MDGSVARLAEVRAAIAADPHPIHRAAHTATTQLITRAGGADGDRFVLGRDQFFEAALGLIGEDDWPITIGVMANMISVVGLAEAEDFSTLDQLVRQYGHESVAAVQTRTDDLLGLGVAMPLASRLTWRLAQTQRIVDVLVASGTGDEPARAIARRCSRAAYWLVMADIDPGSPGPELASVDDVVQCADSGGIRAWRAQVAAVAANPWAPYSVELVGLLRDGDRDAPADMLESAIRHYRDLSERDDRQLVAREVRRLVAMSGLSQRQFAALCGTSAPRISTYVNGLVTPSASMMVRFTRVSELAQRQSRNARGSSA